MAGRIGEKLHTSLASRLKKPEAHGFSQPQLRLFCLSSIWKKLCAPSQLWAGVTSLELQPGAPRWQVLAVALPATRVLPAQTKESPQLRGNMCSNCFLSGKQLEHTHLHPPPEAPRTCGISCPRADTPLVPICIW